MVAAEIVETVDLEAAAGSSVVSQLQTDEIVVLPQLLVDPLAGNWMLVI